MWLDATCLYRIVLHINTAIVQSTVHTYKPQIFKHQFSTYSDINGGKVLGGTKEDNTLKSSLLMTKEVIS